MNNIRKKESIIYVKCREKEVDEQKLGNKKDLIMEVMIRLQRIRRKGYKKA